VGWALPLYLKDAYDVPEELRRLIEEWRLAGGSEVEQARLALQFVQDDSILRSLGVEADPALVNSTMRGAVARRLPSGHAFDHVIAKVTVGGKAAR
jgi:hypothetical protein